MFLPHSLIKMIADERHKELRAQYNIANQFKKSEIQQSGSNRTAVLRFLADNRFQSVIDWLFPDSNASKDIACDVQEFQITPECQSC